MCSQRHSSSSQPDAASVPATPVSVPHSLQHSRLLTTLYRQPFSFSGRALKLEIGIDSASPDLQKQIQNYHYVNCKTAYLNYSITGVQGKSKRERGKIQSGGNLDNALK